MRSSLFSLLIALSGIGLTIAEDRSDPDESIPVLGNRGVDEPLHTDRLGYLRRNQKKRENPAPFVLTDRRGTVRYYVNLKEDFDVVPYLNHHVTVRGDAYQQSHRFDVEEIIPLDTKDLPPLKKTETRTKTATNQPRRIVPRASSSVESKVVSANFQETIDSSDEENIAPGFVTPDGGEDGEMIELSEEYSEDIVPELFNAADDSPSSPLCGWGWWDGSHGPCGSAERFWIRGEYLLWWSQGMRTPALVSTSATGTARADAGVLGVAPTTVLFGGNHLDLDPHSGGRIRAGMWLNSCRTVGLEAEYWGLSEETAHFQQTSPGTPILARPFYDAVNGRETAQLVAFPAVLQGTITVDAITDFQSAGARLLFNACCNSCDFVDPCDPCQVHPRSRRLDWLVGYRYMQLDDTLAIREDLTSLETANPGSFVVRDRFDTRNQFNGGELGVACNVGRCCWTIEMLSKVAIGNNRQQVTINGSTDITQAGVTTPFTGGLLAQRTNIGTYERDQLSVIPELGLTLGCQITPRLRATVGYTFIYWSNVVRAGDQIDRDVNPNLLPPEAPIQTTHLRPEFAFRESDVWLQGLNAGVDLRW